MTSVSDGASVTTRRGSVRGAFPRKRGSAAPALPASAARIATIAAERSTAPERSRGSRGEKASEGQHVTGELLGVSARADLAADEGPVGSVHVDQVGSAGVGGVDVARSHGQAGGRSAGG